MALHFAYGSNMVRVLMEARCPSAVALGTASLPGWRFIIAADGYASIGPWPGAIVHGVLWRLGVRDLAAVNAYESLDSGLYRRRVLPVQYNSHRHPAIVYIAHRGGQGRPRPGYLDVVLAAGRDWHLPSDYIRTLERWAPSRWRGARSVETGELG